jgi:hypothetical protein
MRIRAHALAILSSLLSLQSPAHAGSQPLAKTMLVDILSEPESGLHHQLYLHLNDAGDVEQISRASMESEQIFTLDELLTEEVVLAQASGLDAVLLSCVGCDPNAGGTLVLRHLYNGVTRSYRSFKMQIQRRDRLWDLSSADGVPIRTLTLKSRKVLGAVVGIREIAVNEFEPVRLLTDDESCLGEECSVLE